MMKYLLHGAPTLDTQLDKLVYDFDPAVTGIFGLFFEGINQLDERIYKDDYNTYQSYYEMTGDNVKKYLLGLLQSIEIPEISLRTSQQKTVYNTSIIIPNILEYGSQTINCRFIDTSDGFLFRFFRNWVFSCKRPDQSIEPKNNKDSMIKLNAIYFVADSTLTDITFACGFMGLMPTKIPSDSYSGDISTRNIAILQQQFSYDRIIIDDYMYTYAIDTILPFLQGQDELLQFTL